MYCNRDLKKEKLGTIFFKKEEASAAEKNEFGKCILLVQLPDDVQ